MSFKPGELEKKYQAASAYTERGEFDKAVFRELAQEPEHRVEHNIYWNAFIILESERPQSGLGGIARIPWTAMIQYAERYGMSFDETEKFVEVLRALDTEVITAASREADKANQSKTSK